MFPSYYWETYRRYILLERQMRWVHCHGETGEYVVGTILQILTVAFVLVGNKEEPKHM